MPPPLVPAAQAPGYKKCHSCFEPVAEGSSRCAVHLAERQLANKRKAPVKPVAVAEAVVEQPAVVAEVKEEEPPAKKARALPAGFLTGAELRARLEDAGYETLAQRALEAQRAMIGMERTFRVRVDDATDEAVEEFTRALKAAGLLVLSRVGGMLPVTV
ncbi:MAG: hypothetical protein Q7V62_03685 [Actinomycetota bacterium]|nr:hypothetical protein [Actinomycetota bacterium]